MSTKHLTLLKGSNKEWIFHNRSDELILNINELKYLEKYHLNKQEEKFDYPFKLD